MISTVTSIDTFITDVEEIVVKPIEIREHEVKRVIIIRTKDEVCQLILHGEFGIDLELHRDGNDRAHDWITPKVYKGKSMHEEELDE